MEKSGPIVRQFWNSIARTSADIFAPDAQDVQMMVVILWQPDDAIHEAFVDWLRYDFMTGVLESPETLRSSIYKPYMTMWEFDCDELPWDVLISLGTKEGWRRFVDGGQVQWQVGMYLMNRVYPERSVE
jgi:hypothetical protein